MLQIFATWFEPARVRGEYRRQEWLVLSIVLACGVFVRFWGLQNVGLHGDEETTAMPSIALLHEGAPAFPSGMLYLRAPLHTVMVAASVWLFGETEWAMRLPSALVGSLAGLFAFFMGRRFLKPAANIAFVASITFMPAMIEASQTARMYVFWVTSLMAYVVCIFRWERTQSRITLLAAFGTWLIALQFHVISILLAPLLLFPGLANQSMRQLMYGVGTLAICIFAYIHFGDWVVSFYPTGAEEPPPLTELYPVQSTGTTSPPNLVIMIGCVAGILMLTGILLRRIKRSSMTANPIPVLLVMCGLLAMTMRYFHIGGMLFLFGAIFWLRSPQLPRPWLAGAFAIALTITVVQLILLAQTGLYPGRKILGALVGEPSIWPILRFLTFSPAAAIIYAIVLIAAFARFANGHKLPMHFLFFVIAVWAPLVVIGIRTWDSPPRYGMASLPCLLLCVFAALDFLARLPQLKGLTSPSGSINYVLLAAVTVAFINPVALARTVNPSYGVYPDHRGAADFIRNLGPNATRVVIAEDVLQQTYYLDKVDYWLREVDNAHGYCVMRNGQLLDQYTGTPLVGTGDELSAVLDRSAGRDLYIIGSGENFIGDSRIFRGRGIQEILDSRRLVVVYEGRDGRTKVWKLVNET